MDIAKMQESLKSGCEMWMHAANAVARLESMPDVSTLNLAMLQLGELCDLLNAARNELIHGLAEGRIFEEESELLLVLYAQTVEVLVRFQNASHGVPAKKRLVLLQRTAHC